MSQNIDKIYIFYLHNIHKCILYLSFSSGATLKYISKSTEYTDSLGSVISNSYEMSSNITMNHSLSCEAV